MKEHSSQVLGTLVRVKIFRRRVRVEHLAQDLVCKQRGMSGREAEKLRKRTLRVILELVEVLQLPRLARGLLVFPPLPLLVLRRVL